MPNKIIPYNPHLKEFARGALWKQGVLSEVLLWKQLKRKNLGVEFHRQVPIDEYIVDFYCHEKMPAIEIDGASHDHFEKVKVNDEIRQRKLEEFGIKFLRFHDHEIKRDISMAVNAILLKLEEPEKES